jgi:2-alkyl-3-oxoalkanoate reductase
MKALVTGGSGFLGGHLVARLVREGHEVTVLARKGSDTTHLSEKVRVLRGDLDDARTYLGIMDGIEVVFHLGAATSGNWAEMERTTVEGTERLLLAALDAGVRRFVHVSSVVVYQVGALANNTPLDERALLELRPHIVGPYTRSKIEAEKLVRACQQQGLPTVIVRPGLIFGPRGRDFWPNIGVMKGRLCLLASRGDDLLPLVHVEDVVHALMLAAITPEAVGRAYHVADRDGISKRAYLELLGEARGRKILVVPMPVGLLSALMGFASGLQRFGLLRNKSLPNAYGLRSKYRGLRFDCTRAITELGWRPRLSLEQRLKEHLLPPDHNRQQPAVSGPVEA